MVAKLFMSLIRLRNQLGRLAGLTWALLLASFATASISMAKAPPGKEVDSALSADLVAAQKAGQFEKIDPRAFDLFVHGLLMEYSGDLLSAAQLYERALDYFAKSYEIRFSLAAALYNLRRPGEALDQIKKLSILDGQAYGLAAACYRALNDAHSAAVAYRRQVQFDSMSVGAYSYLSGYYHNNNKFDSAVWAYHNLIRLLPDNVQVLNELGRLEAQQGNIDSALSAFTRSVAMRSDTGNAAAVVSLAETFEIKDQLDSATTVLEKAIHLNPDQIHYRHSLINLYARMDSVSRALPHARYVAEKFPTDGFAARRLGILYFSMDSLQKSDSIFNARLKAGEMAPLNYYYLGRAELRRKEWKKAAEQFERMTQVSDTSSTAWISLSAAYRQMGDSGQTIDVLRRGAEKVQGEKAALDIYYALGAAYEQLGKIDSARITFEEILSHAPNFAQALNYLGYMFADRNIELDRAKVLIAKALDLEPNNGAFLDSFGWVLYRQGNFAEAVTFLLKAAEAQPDPTVFDHLGDVYQYLNQPDSANSWWKKALDLQPENDQIKKKLSK
jgi:tetratricopeptide (TPR) repeat protein